MISRIVSRWAALMLVLLPAYAGFGAIVKAYEAVDPRDRSKLPGEVVRENLLADDTAWEATLNHGSRLRVVRAGGVLTVDAPNVTAACDTAWSVCTRRLPLTVKGLGYVLSFRLDVTMKIRRTGGHDRYLASVIWYDAQGEKTACDPLPLGSVPGEDDLRVLIGSVPAAAESFAINLGFDNPNMKAGDRLTVRELRFAVMQHETDPRWTPQAMPEEPRVRIVSASPTTNAFERLAIRVSAAKPVDFSRVRVSVDGAELGARLRHRGDLVGYVPEKPWAAGLHKVAVTLIDPETGGEHTAQKYFLIGDGPRTTRSRLRADGMVLVDEKPFFPIGIYGVMKREANGNDFDRACADLAAAGFNTVQSYTAPREPEFLDAAQRHGLKVFAGVRYPDARFAERDCRHPAVFAWYVGDDTSMHVMPAEVYDRVDGVHACDPWRITTQADVMNSGDPVSSYFAFVKTTDVFMPEVYPVNRDAPAPDCVARAVRDLERFKTDVAESKDTRPHGIWPIIQYFKGWSSWHRFPTRDELYAMTWASIAHGANGVTFYTYGGMVEPERKAFNYGITSSPEVWTNMTNLTTRLSQMAPVFLAPAVAQPQAPVVVEGPAHDPLGQPAISFLLKRHEGKEYLLLVNGTETRLVAEFASTRRAARAEVLWEGRSLAAKNGCFRDVFEPFAVHVYRLNFTP